MLAPANSKTVIVDAQILFKGIKKMGELFCKLDQLKVIESLQIAVDFKREFNFTLLNCITLG